MATTAMRIVPDLKPKGQAAGSGRRAGWRG